MNSNSKLVNATRQNDSLTTNGMVTNSTSLNSNVDLFFLTEDEEGVEVELLVEKYNQKT